MKKNTKNIKLLSTMIFITVFTQIFVIFKNSIIAKNFGASTEIDAFYFANNISTFIFSFIGASISTIIMPNLARENKIVPINIFITLIYLFALGTLILMLVFHNQIFSSLSGSNNYYFIEIGSNIFLATLIAGFFGSIINLINGILEFKGQFIKLRIITLLISVSIVLLLIWHSSSNIYYYAGIVLGTTLINVMINSYILFKSDFRFKVNFDINNKEFIIMLKLFIPVVLSQGLYQTSLLIDTMIASRLGTGQISLLTFSTSIIAMINILVLSNMMSIIYPKLIRSVTEKELQEKLVQYTTILNFAMCMIIALFFINGKEGIAFLYERGNFTSKDTHIVYVCVIIYILSLPFNSARDLIYKYFYIKGNTISPFINSLLISCLNITLSLILANYFNLYGVVLGTTIASMVSLILISINLWGKFPITFNTKKMILENSRIVILTFIGISGLWKIKTHFIIDNVVTSILIYSVLTILVFLFLFLVFFPEIRTNTKTKFIKNKKSDAILKKKT